METEKAERNVLRICWKPSRRILRQEGDRMVARGEIKKKKKTCGVEMSCSADGASLEDQRRRGPPCSLPPTLSPGDTHPIHPILPPPSYFVFPVTKGDLFD